jgi:CBS domain-containing protein
VPDDGLVQIELLMTRDVVTLPPDASLKQAAATLSEHQISGAPVCDADGRVIGVLSEADILRKEQGISPELRGWKRRLARVFDHEVDKVEARVVGEAMTSPALTVRPFEPVARAARLMVEHRINRLPVVADGRLVGIVTRADLVRAFHRGDDEIADQIRDEVLVRALWLAPEALDVDVRDGVVSIGGTVDTESDARVVQHLVRGIPGVVDVTAELYARYPERPARGSIVEFFPR